MHCSEQLKALGLTLPQVPAPVGSYVPVRRTGNLLYTSGTLPLQDGKLAYVGKVGQELTVEQAQSAARICALNLLALAQSQAGSLEAVAAVVSLTGYVNGVDGFSQSPAVLNGASDLLVQVLGDAGRHTRSAVSVNGLPMNAPVEISAVFELCD